MIFTAEVRDSGLQRLRKPYNTCHTFISRCLVTKMNPVEVANISGHDVQTLYWNYELQAYLDAPRLCQQSLPRTWQLPLLTVQFVKDGLSLSLFSAIATLSTPHDITLQELRIESLFPADEVAQTNLRKLAHKDIVEAAFM